MIYALVGTDGPSGDMLGMSKHVRAQTCIIWAQVGGVYTRVSGTRQIRLGRDGLPYTWALETRLTHAGGGYPGDAGQSTSTKVSKTSMHTI